MRRDVFDLQITHDATYDCPPTYIYIYLIDKRKRRRGSPSRMINAPAVVRLTLDVNVYGVRADPKLRCQPCFGFGYGERLYA